MDPKVKEARSVLAAEWASSSPRTPDEVAAFYRDSRALRLDLEAWHQTQSRKLYTLVISTVAKQIGAKLAVDIGAGIGNDLRALRKVGVDAVGVEPNTELRAAIERGGIRCHEDVAAAPIEDADLIVCIDVLEHVPAVDDFLSSIARRARANGERPGAVLIETTSTHDNGTPLHLAESRGWHPGHILESYGWSQIDQSGPIRVWQRTRTKRPDKADSLIVCAYRTLTLPTFHSIQRLDQKHKGWRIITKTGDALVSRARSITASRWLMETADDVFLMVDDDITFFPEVAERIVELAKDHDIVCAAYPVRSGEHLALRGFDPNQPFEFGADLPLAEIDWAGTGFVAVHRRVLEEMRKTLTLCHENESWAFWPFFMPMIVEREGVQLYLSEDWAFCERAHALGFKVWLDPSVRIGHLATVEINVGNMQAVHAAVRSGFESPQ